MTIETCPAKISFVVRQVNRRTAKLEGIAQLGAPANGGNPPRCRETTIQSKSPETLETQWFPVIWGYSSAGSPVEAVTHPSKKLNKKYSAHPFIWGYSSAGSASNQVCHLSPRETTVKSKSPETPGTQGFPVIWGYSSAGRALEWHSRGQRFDPAYLHQKQ